MTTTVPGLTSNTYSFAPSNADLFLEAFERIGMVAAALTRDHIIAARRSVNYLFVQWANRGVNLWAVDIQTINLAGPSAGVGVAAYFPPPNTVQVLDVYYTQVNGGGQGIDIDRMLLPMSRTDYAETPNKLQPGTPTRFWFERVIPPVIHLWQADILTGNKVRYYRMRRLMDASPQMGETADVEYRFLDALAAALAERMAEKFAPARLTEKRAEAKEAWDLATSKNRDDAPISMRPNLSGYYR